MLTVAMRCAALRWNDSWLAMRCPQLFDWVGQWVRHFPAYPTTWFPSPHSECPNCMGKPIGGSLAVARRRAHTLYSGIIGYDRQEGSQSARVFQMT